jgi:outer membrane cobalamin receptor
MNWFTEIKIFNINGSHMPDYWGIGVNSEFNIWKLSLEFQTQYNKPRNKDNVFFNFTEFHFRGGIFFKDVLFDSSLCLKTGFSFYHFGKQKLFDFDEEFMIVDPSSRIDFTLAGEIQNTAIVYFTWENLLNENYYIVPYYPMPERSIRFGIAWEILN